MAECIILKGGGGADLDVITAGAGDIISGKVIVGPDGEPLTGTLALSGDATAANVLSGKTFYNTDAKSKVTGSMTNRGAQTKTFTPSTAKQTYTIPAGYHNGSGVVTCNAIPSSYVSIAGGITFFKDGAFGQFVQNVGLGKYRPRTYGTNQGDGWYDVPLWAGDQNSIDLTTLIETYDKVFLLTEITNIWCTRKSINFDKINTITIKYWSSSSGVTLTAWFYNLDTKLVKFVSFKGNITSINISSITGNCVFGIYKSSGTGNPRLSSMIFS